MADVTLTYNGSDILELSDSGSATLKTGGKYCEDDIAVEYVKPSGGSTDNVVVALPSGYKVVNCVSIPMGGYVNTLIVPSRNIDRVYIDARLDTPVSSIDSSCAIAGSKSGNSTVAGFSVFAPYSGFIIQFLSPTYYTSTIQKDNNRHAFYTELKSGYCAIDSEVSANGYTANASTASPMLLAARQTSDGTGIERQCAVTIWRYTHARGEETLIDLIPCQRKSDGEYGFYDLVSESFFGNLGTGTFTEGVE